MSFFFGTILSLIVVYWTMILLGTTPADFMDLHAFVIVVLGSIAATATSYNFIHLLKLPIYMLKAVLPQPMKIAAIVMDIKRMADKARQGGLPALTSEIPGAPDEFARRGIKMLVAGNDSTIVQRVLEADIQATHNRHIDVIGFFEALGGNAPTFGLLGTVLGIVEGLGHIDDVAALGHALAVALMATLYGVFSANVIWLPLAAQLKGRSQTEERARKMYLEGLLCVQAGFTSEVVDKLMKSHVDVKTRAKIEGGKIGGKKSDRHVEYISYMSPQDQERAMAVMAEVKREGEAKNLGQDDVKMMLAELINEADDKVLAKDFCTEFMKVKLIKKLPKGAKRKGKRKKKAAARKIAD